MGYIYKITNDINDKVYVGKTCNTPAERFHKHCLDSKRKTMEKRPLYVAMNKYGVEHFKVETIGEYPEEELENMEIYWIGYYNGYTDGYNATKGGDGKILYNHQEILDRLKECPYPVIIANEFGCCPEIVRDIAKINNIEIKNYWVEQSKRQVAMIDKKTNKIIRQFESTQEAAKWCIENNAATGKVDGTHIAAVCRGNSNRKTAYGYKWEYVE